jgi:hypothetical protein
LQQEQTTKKEKHQGSKERVSESTNQARTKQCLDNPTRSWENRPAIAWQTRGKVKNKQKSREKNLVMTQKDSFLQNRPEVGPLQNNAQLVVKTKS